MQIDQSFQVQTGDQIELYFNILSLFEQSQMDSLMEQISSDPRFDLYDYEIINKNWYSDTLLLKVKIIQNPFPLLAIVIAIATVGTSVFLYLTFSKAELISRTLGTEGAGSIASTMKNISIGILLVIGIGAYLLLRR